MTDTIHIHRLRVVAEHAASNKAVLAVNLCDLVHLLGLYDAMLDSLQDLQRICSSTSELEIIDDILAKIGAL